MHSDTKMWVEKMRLWFIKFVQSNRHSTTLINVRNLKSLSPRPKAQSIKERRNSVEKLLDFEIAAFFRHLHGEGKKAAISNIRSFSTK